MGLVGWWQLTEFANTKRSYYDLGGHTNQPKEGPMPEPTVTLPAREQLIERLRKADDGREPHRERLFNLIANGGGGRQFNARELAALMATALETYCQDMHPGTVAYLRTIALRYIEVLVDDETVRAAALEELKDNFGL